MLNNSLRNIKKIKVIILTAKERDRSKGSSPLTRLHGEGGQVGGAGQTGGGGGLGCPVTEGGVSPPRGQVSSQLTDRTAAAAVIIVAHVTCRVTVTCYRWLQLVTSYR